MAAPAYAAVLQLSAASFDGRSPSALCSSRRGRPSNVEPSIHYAQTADGVTKIVLQPGP